MEGVAVDPRSGIAAIAIGVPPQLALLELATGRVVRRVALPGTARHVQLGAPGGPFVVPVETADAVLLVDPRTGAVRREPAGDHPHDAAMAGPRIFAGDEFGSTLSVLRAGRTVGTVPVDVQPGGVAVVGDQIAVISVRAYTVELYPSGEDRPAGGGAQSAGLGPSHVVAGAGGRLTIADTRGRALMIYDTVPRLRFRARVPVPGAPYGLAADPSRGRVWVTLSDTNQLLELTDDGRRPRVLRRLPTVRQPNSVGVDTRTGRVVVASRTDATVQLIDP